MQQFKKDQQIPLTQVTDPNTGQVYYSPQNVVYNDKNGNGPQYLRNVIVDQATTASYFSGSITNAISASYALTASYVAGNVASASYALTASYLLGSIASASYATTASYANYAETASSALNAQDILIYVKNQSGAPIAKGVVVHITASGNSSDIPRVITASYENDNNSANTLGITNQSIANGAEGFVMTEGVLKGINTNAFVSGQLIYLGPTGSIIGYAPTAPLHSVRLGQVVREQSNNGSIYVRIDNGYELGELHDVRDTTTTSSYGDLLVKSGSVWTNSKQLTGSYAITGSLTATSFTGSFSGSGTITSASYAVQAGNTNTINVNSFSSPVESYLLMSNVVATTGVAIGGDSDLRYNSSTNVLTVPNVSATTLTGSLLGTASYAAQATSAFTASYVLTAQTASYVLNAVSSSYALSASFALSSSRAISASFALSSSRAVSASFATLAQTANTASYVLTAQTASYVLNAVSASFASTASYVNPLVQNVIITGFLITSASNGNGINTSNTTLNSGILPTVDWGNRQLYDTNNIVVDWGQSFLISSISSSVTVQWGVGYLRSLNTSMSINWDSRSAFDANAASSIDWNSRDLLDNSLARSVNWQYRELYDRLGVSSVNWDNRILNDSTGATKLRWDSTGVQVTGSLIVSGSSTFTNIGPAIFSGSITQNASTASFAGLVGIGTTTPAYKLDVSGSINTNTGLTVTGSLLISGSATIGSSSPSTENTLTLGPPPGGGTGEGGQLGLQSTGGSYTSASFIDTWQNQFRILRGTNASSNAGLMYMNLQTGNTNFIGAVTASGGYSNLPNDYLYATRATSNQTIGSGTWANRDIIFNNTVVSKGISYNTGTGLATLTGGKVYRITSRLAWSAAATYNLQFSCYDSANNQIGPTIEIIQSTNGTNNISDGTLDFIYAPGSNIDVKIRTTNNTTALTGEQIRYDLNTQFIIQQIA